MIIPVMPVPFARYSSPLMERRPKPLLLFPLVYEHDTLFTSMQNYVCGPRTILSHPSPLALFLSAHVNAEREPGIGVGSLERGQVIGEHRRIPWRGSPRFRNVSGWNGVVGGRLRSGIPDGNDGSLEFRFHRDKFIPSRPTWYVQFPLIYHYYIYIV